MKIFNIISYKNKMEGQMICLICTAGGVFLIILVFAICWDGIEPTEYGLIYNSISKAVDRKNVYESGRYFLFPTNSFVTFPKTAVTIDFTSNPKAKAQPLQTRTKEGLALTLHLSFQYQLLKNKLADLYIMYNIHYEATFIRIARDTILQEAGQYEAPDYWLNRTMIGDSMKNALNKAFGETGAQCISLQMIRIDLPETYENQIVLTQVEVQKKRTKEYEQSAAVIRAQTQVNISDAERIIANVTTLAKSQAYLIRQTATATALKNIINAESMAYQTAMIKLGFNKTEMMKYIYYLFIQGTQNSTLLFGVDQGIININSRPPQ